MSPLAMEPGDRSTIARFIRACRSGRFSADGGIRTTAD